MQQVSLIAACVAAPAGAQLQQQVASLKEGYSQLTDALEGSQGSAKQVRFQDFRLL